MRQVRKTLPPGPITEAEQERIILELGHEKTVRDRNRKAAKFEAMVKRSEVKVRTYRKH